MLFNVEYYHAPPREIDQAIVWLRGVIADCEAKIDRLQALKNADARQERHFQKMNELADLFDDPDFYGVDLSNQIEIIRQRLGCSYERAERVHDLLRRRKKHRDKKARDALILRMWKEKRKMPEIKQAAGISRQACYDVIKEAKKRGLL